VRNMDISSFWRSLCASAGPPQAGAHIQTAEAGITINVMQDCRIALPTGNRFPAVSVMVASNRPGVAAQVSVAANLNSPDGSYQGPTTVVGQGQFTATASSVLANFIVLPSGWPVLGVGAEAIWADGAPNSLGLTYVQLECDPWVWWRWLIPVLNTLGRFSVRTGSPSRST
jgi:hypothetical protein